MKQIYLLDGGEINEPDNYQELQIDVTFDKDSSSEAVTVNQWDFGVNDQRNANDAVMLLLDYIEKGKTGGTGVFEGIPFKIKLDNEKGAVYQLFDGYIDLSQAAISNGQITAPAVEQGKLDWLNEVADSFSFEYLADENYKGPGKISKSDYIAVPYVINKKINAVETIVSLVTIFVVVNELRRIVNTIYWDLIHCQNPLEFTFIITLALNIIYAISVFISLVKLIVDLFNTLVQPVKYHYGMLAKTMIEKGFEYLGLNFSSSILQKHPFDKLVIIPEKYQIFEQNTGIFENVTGFLKVNTDDKLGYYKGTFGQLLRELKNMFHAKFIEDGGTYYFEKQNFLPSAPAYQLPDYEDTNGYGFNSTDFFSNYVISFQTDLNDKNTIQEYTGTSVQIQQVPVSITNKKMVLTKGLQQINISFALGRRKTELNYIEKIMDTFFSDLVDISKFIVDVANAVTRTINEVIGIINKTIKALKVVGIKVSFTMPQIPVLTVPKFINQVDGSRLNMLKMENDYLTVPKMVLIDPKANPRNNVLMTGNEVYLSAKYLWDNYHYFSSFVKQTDDYHNQYLTKVTPEIPFTFDDYTKVRRSNQLLTADGKKGRITAIKFNPDKQTATINYEVNEIYTSNLKQVIIEPNGK